MRLSSQEIALLLDTSSHIISTSGTRDKALKNISELLAEKIPHYHWVGFYIVDDSGDNLILGPYVGAPTDHTRIAFGKGVCGQVAVSQMSRIIQDVSMEENYLSCSSNVQSEVVFPIMKSGKFVAELDIDSHDLSPFSDQDTEFLGALCHQLEVLF
ncbi:GAF domain-containing protein [bacterium]|nr:GAF domain-containing protein [bacterium]